MTTNYSLLNWENPDPYDAGYWLALRDALTSRRISMDTIIAGHHTPFNHGRLVSALITAIRGSLTLWSDTPAATSWAMFSRSFLSVAETPILGYPIASTYWVEILKTLHGAILKLSHRKVAVSIETSWGYHPDLNFVSQPITPNAFLDSIYPTYGGAGGYYASRISYANFWNVVGASEGAVYLYQSVGRVSIINPLPVSGTAHVAAAAIETAGGPFYPETPFDAFGTGFIEGDNEFAVTVGKTVILADSTPPRHLDTDSYYDGATELEGRGFALPEYAWIDYGESLILAAS